jgi:hypothetical protein
VIIVPLAILALIAMNALMAITRRLPRMAPRHANVVMINATHAKKKLVNA